MKKTTLFLLFFIISTSLIAQDKISIEDFAIKGIFNERSIYGINWMNKGSNYTSLANNSITNYDIKTGKKVKILLDGNALPSSLRIDSYQFSTDEKKILLMTDFKYIYRRSFTAAYYIYDFTTKKLEKLSHQGKLSYATISPDGKKVAFVSGNNLFYVTLSDMAELQITSDGKFNQIINGSTDWVYEEEFSITKAFFWSPDSKRIAYLRFDEREVKEYSLQKWNDGALYPENYIYKYPKAGEKNSTVSVNIYELDSKKMIPVDIGDETDIYIPRMEWTNNPNILSVVRSNRLQNKVEILHGDAATGKTKTIYTDAYDTYVDIDDVDDLTYLNDGKHFIISSEKSGFKHLYLYSIEGGIIRQITKGDWEVKDFLGFDENNYCLYYTSTEVSPLERHFYKIDLSGKNKKKLSTSNGVNLINMSTDYQYYINFHSNENKPLEVSLYKTKNNQLIDVLEKNRRLKSTLQNYDLSKKEYYTFKSADGKTKLNGYMLKPQNFDANKRYPVLIYQYSGPGSQNTSKSWGGRHFFFHQMLVQQGYIVAVVDGRGTGSRGAAFKKITYKQLGKYETEDQIEAAKYLGSLGYINKSRIGIWGWSYGGYISSLAMFKGAKYFKTGIAVAPVTSWRYYDTIYTERYLQRPQDNASGYDDNSPITHAGKLEGNFLLIHGTGDDNVHFQNSVALENALINSGKQFSSFYYPDKTHGIGGRETRAHLYTLMKDFIINNL